MHILPTFDVADQTNSQEPGSQVTKRDNVDHYQLMTNGCPTGPINQIQVSKNLVTSVHGIVFDIDPKNFDGAKHPAISEGPVAFYEKVVSTWLRNNEVLKKAEVRMTGTGLHVILWFRQPIELDSESGQDQWDCIVKVVQACLPIDPGQPSITCCTRAVGSTNSKNGAMVIQLVDGEPVTEKEIIGLYEAMRTEPFRTVCKILYGGDKVVICPVCQLEGTSLSAFKHKGKCYKCKDVLVDQLYASVFTPGSQRDAQ